MHITDEGIEREIVEKGKATPRITPKMLENQIVAEHWGRASDLFKDAPALRALECLTICVLVTKNGFTLVGSSACAAPENYDAEIGRKIARQNAVAKIWPLLGFRLRDKLAAG